MKDRDRIIHHSSFRRLKQKTQVFLSCSGENYRTRLTHTLEVAQIARTLARLLFLNEDLTEAIALGHDVGHTPFGHSGEQAIRDITNTEFKHSDQSVRVLNVISNKNKGINLSFEVLEGIKKHSKTGKKKIFSDDPKDLPQTLEGQLVRISDIIAYVNHDIDDAVRNGILDIENLPKRVLSDLGKTHGERIDTLVKSVYFSSRDKDQIYMDPKILKELENLRNFLFDSVYHHPTVESEMQKVKKIIFNLYEYLEKNMDFVYMKMEKMDYGFETKNPKKTLIDFIALMTDNEALDLFYKIYLPRKSYFYF